MKVVSIFVSEEGEEAGGLWAVQYTDEPNEYERLFDVWNDVEYLEKFCREHVQDLPQMIWDDSHENIHNIVIDLLEEANELEEELTDLVTGGFTKNGKNLQQIFKPLDNRVYELKTLQKSKASTSFRPEPKLRIYAVRLAPNLYVITGGAIKFNFKMDDRPHLVEELKKIERVRQWLKDNDITEPEDLNDQF